MDRNLIIGITILVIVLIGAYFFVYKKERYIAVGGTGAFSISPDGSFVKLVGANSQGVNTVNVDSSGNLYADSGIPPGSIIMWTGTSAPTGWAICDGTEGTPDLRSRFVVGATVNQSQGAQLTNSSISSNSTVLNPGSYGGEEYHTLSIGEMPSHSHGISTNTDSTGNWVSSFNGGTGEDYSTKDAGGSQPHNNMPPFYALLFIMKLAPTSSS